MEVLPPLILPGWKSQFRARIAARSPAESYLRNILFRRLKALAEFAWENNDHGDLTNAELLIHIRPEFQQEGDRRWLGSALNAPDPDWCFVRVPDQGWEALGSEYRGYRNLRPSIRGIIGPWSGGYPRRAEVWSRRSEFFAWYRATLRAYEQWEREALSIQSIRQTIGVLSIASRAFHQEKA